MSADPYKIYDPKFMAEQQETYASIAKSFGHEFKDRWAGVRAEVPVDWINFPVLQGAIETNNPGLITEWYEPVNSPEDFEEFLGELSEAFVHWILVSRKSVIQQYINLYNNLGYLETVLTDDGQFEYERAIEREEAGEAVNKFIDLLLEAIKNNK